MNHGKYKTQLPESIWVYEEVFYQPQCSTGHSPVSVTVVQLRYFTGGMVSIHYSSETVNWEENPIFFPFWNMTITPEFIFFKFITFMTVVVVGWFVCFCFVRVHIQTSLALWIWYIIIVFLWSKCLKINTLPLASNKKQQKQK